MNEKIEKLEKEVEKISLECKQSAQGSQERKELLNEWEKLENELFELLVENRVELNSWDW